MTRLEQLKEIYETTKEPLGADVIARLLDCDMRRIYSLNARLKKELGITVISNKNGTSVKYSIVAAEKEINSHLFRGWVNPKTGIQPTKLGV